MTQTARPVADITTTNWTTAPLFSKVNDASDATTIRNNNGVTTACEVQLAAVLDPLVSTGHVVSVRGFATGSSAGEQMEFVLMQGTTTIATAAGATLGRTTPSTRTLTLSGAEADAITNYADLRVRVRMSSGAATEFLTIADIWMDVPDLTSQGAAASVINATTQAATGVVAVAGAAASSVTLTQSAQGVVPVAGSAASSVALALTQSAQGLIQDLGPAFQSDAFQTDAFQTGGGVVTGAASLTGTGSLVSGLGKRTVHGAAVLSGTGSIAAVGKGIKRGTATLVGTGTLVTTPRRKAISPAALTGTGTVAVAARTMKFVAASLTGAGTIAATTHRVAKSAVALVGTGDLSASGEIEGAAPLVVGQAHLTATGNMEGTFKRDIRAAAVLSGAGAMAASAQRTGLAAASLTGAGSAAIWAVQTHHAQVLLSGTGTLVADRKGIVRGAASLGGQGALFGVGRRKKKVASSLAGLGLLSAKGIIVPFVPPPIPTTEYRLDLCDLSGSVVRTDVLTFDYSPELVYGYALNGPGALSFMLPATKDGVTPDNYRVGERTLLLYRDDVLVWGGYLTDADGDRDWVTFGATGWYEALRHRIISDNLHFLAIEAIDIVWTLINYTQAKDDIGLTHGVGGATGKLRTRDYCCDDMTLVSEAIEDLAQSRGGFDFWVSPDKAFNTAHPRLGADSDVVFDAATNVSELSHNATSEQLATKVWYVGPNPDECRDLETQEANVGTYGLYELGVDTTSIKNQEGRDDFAGEFLDNQSVPLVQASLTAPAELGIEPGDFFLGDRCSVVSSKGWPIDQTMRVIDFSVHVAEDCVEEQQVQLDSVLA